MEIEEKLQKQRTIQQNNAMHKYFQEVADELNQSGIEPAIFLENFEISHTPESVKDIFRQIGNQKFGKDSTAKFNTNEINQILQEMDRQLAKFGLIINFPSWETKSIIESYEKNYTKAN